MTPLSRWKLAEKEEDRIKSLFVDQLTIIADKKEMKDFLKTILTDTELLMIAKRLIAFLLIEKGKNDVEIGKLLHITRATSNRYRQVYFHATEMDYTIKEKVNNLKDKSEVDELLKRLLEYLLTAPFGKIPKRSIF